MNDLQNPQTPQPVSSEPFPPTPPVPPVSAPTRSRRGLIIGIIIVAVVLLLLLTAGVVTSVVYLRPPTDTFVRKVASVVPYPAAYVNGKPILLREYLLERDAIATYLASSGADASGTDPQTVSDNVLDTLINKAVLSQLAEKWGVGIDETKVQEILKDAQGDDPQAFANELSKNFGWSVDQFQRRVLNSLVLANQLTDYVAGSDEIQKDARGKIDAARSRLDAGEDFAIVAGDVSEDASAKSGGDVGFVPIADLKGTEYEPVVSLKDGEYSPVISTQDAYLLVKANERVTKPEGEEYKLSVIVVKKRTLEELVTEYLGSVKVRRLLTRV